jgi:hypothetical protein
MKRRFKPSPGEPARKRGRPPGVRNRQTTIEAALFGRKDALPRPLPDQYALPDNITTRLVLENRDLTTKLSHATNELVALRALYAQVCQSAGLPQPVLDAASQIARLYGTPPSQKLNTIEWRRMMVFYAMEARQAGANMSAFYAYHGISHVEILSWAKAFRLGTHQYLKPGAPQTTVDPVLRAMNRDDRLGHPALENLADRQPAPFTPTLARKITETLRQKQRVLRRIVRYSTDCSGDETSYQ